MPIDLNPPLRGPGYRYFKNIVMHFRDHPDTEFPLDVTDLTMQPLIYCLAHGYVVPTTPDKYEKFMAWKAFKTMGDCSFKYPGLRFKTTQKGLRALICHKTLKELWDDHSAFARLGL
jgi:hypothetical protein